MYKIRPFVKRSLACFCLLTLFACAPSQPTSKKPLPVFVIAPNWKPLYNRLKNDKISTRVLPEYFDFLGEKPSEVPMGTKIKELYSYGYGKKHKTPEPPKKVEQKEPTKPKTQARPPRRTGPPVYRNVVTDANAALCLEYLEKHKEAFALMEENTGVPPSVIAALLFVETRLGKVLGKESAFKTLASMAASNEPKYITKTLETLPGINLYPGWLNRTLQKRSDWAYNELVALLRFSEKNKLDPRTMPGSVYGAIGICQFMPSNLSIFAADGDNNGRIDLFVDADAIASAANYLKRHGWKEKLTRAQQHRVIKRYNHLNIYANTILALSDHIKKIGKK